MDRKDTLTKIAMTLLSQDQENKSLTEENDNLKKEAADQLKTSSVDNLVNEMIERGVISDADIESKREELMGKTAEEIDNYKNILNDLVSNAPVIGEVSKEADADTGDKWDQWLTS